MKRLNRILSLALAAMMALTLLTGCGGKVTERAMEKAYGDYLRGQMGKPDMKVTYDVSPAAFEKIDADLRKNKAQWFNGTYLASYNAGEYFYVPWNTGTAGAGVAMLEDALKDYSTSVRVQFYAAKMPESEGNAITQAAYVLYCSRGGVRVPSNSSSSDWTGVKVAVHRVQDGGDTYCYMIVIYEK